MITNTEERMQKSIHALHEELATIRTGRAHASLLDHVQVPYYGAEVPVNQVANLNVPEPRMIVVAPWEKQMLPVIEKAILSSDIGVTPSSDGEVIRIVMPELTQERRLDLVKKVKHIAEMSKVAIRNIRRHTNDEIKKQAKDKEISEDESKNLQDEIQQLTDRYITEIDKVVEHKEQEILTI